MPSVPNRQIVAGWKYHPTRQRIQRCGNRIIGDVPFSAQGFIIGEGFFEALFLCLRHQFIGCL